MLRKSEKAFSSDNCSSGNNENVRKLLCITLVMIVVVLVSSFIAQSCVVFHLNSVVSLFGFIFSLPPPPYSYVNVQCTIANCDGFVYI
jgi:1,4-dihydroxy-2-naphthoate octaprenyltransferase